MDFTEQELLIDRLDNWGRVYGERRPPGWRSSLLGVLSVTDVTDRLRIGAAIRNAGNSYSHRGFFFSLRMLRMNSSNWRIFKERGDTCMHV